MPKTIKRENLEIAWDLQNQNNQFNVDESIDMTVENERELSVMKHETECLKKKLHEGDAQMQEQKLRAVKLLDLGNS